MIFRWQDRLELEFYSEEFFKQPNLFVYSDKSVLKQNSEVTDLLLNNV